MTELIKQRRNVEKHDIEKKKTERDAKVSHLQNVSFKDYYKPQEFVEEPNFTSTWQKLEAEKPKARNKAGLNAHTIDINPDKLPDPSLKWVTNTDVNIMNKRKAEML